MGVRFPSGTATVLLAATLVTTAETIVVTCGPIINLFDSAVAIIFWTAVVTFGTAITAIIPRIRAGTTLAGTLVNSAPSLTAIAANTAQISGSSTSTLGTSSGIQFSLTLQQVAATGNAAIAEAGISAIVL